MKLTFYDKLFIFLIIIAAAGLLAFNFKHESSREQKYVRVYVDNELVKEVSFNDQVTDEIMIPFGDDNNYEAVLEIKDGKVRMVPINEELCPRGICTHTGWISRGYESILCVPNRIFVEFSEREVNGIDGVTY